MLKRHWKANPQAMAAVSKRTSSTCSPDLSTDSDGDTWLTPRYILSQLGEFDLDPCAAALNPKWICNRSFTKDQDGLRSAWTGRVFMNPPFSNSAPWLERHAEYGNGISLVTASVESKVWRQFVWREAKGILLLHGRTRFCNPDGSTTTGRPLRSIALIAWSSTDAHFLETSTLAGVFLTQWAAR